MLYFDTSFLVPLILEEPTSNKVERFLQSRRSEEIAVSHWTRVEFSSLLAREVRMGGLPAKAAVEADIQFETVIDESFVVLLPTISIFRRSFCNGASPDCAPATRAIWRSRPTTRPG
jgi:uncharacterized protein